MSTAIIMKDELRALVEAASGGKQTILRTTKGNPSYMNIIPKFRLEDLHPTAMGSGVHPAFLVNGVEKSEVFIGTYQAAIRDGEAVSLPGEVPATSINFDNARAACLAAGPGFHLMSNLEWAAIALWCAANGHDVRGNTGYGNSHSHPDEKGIRAGNGGVTLTGSGPDSWRHDGTPFGISDLVGNVWEWNDGAKLVGGKIFMCADNAFSANESDWSDTGISINDVGGIQMDSKITKRGWVNKTFGKITCADENLSLATLKQALLFPIDAMNLNGHLWADNTEGFEAMPIRGGGWCDGSGAGLAALLRYVRSDARSYLGFRPAFIE